MMRLPIRSILAMGSLVAIAACNKVSAEQAAKLAADSARAEGRPAAEVVRRADRARNVVLAHESGAKTRTLAAGTTLQLAGVTDVTSQKDQAGKAFTARTLNASLNSAGDTVIPIGAELLGSVTQLEPAGSPGASGTLVIALHTVRIGGVDYPIETRIASMGTRSVARGITVEDGAKVGAGAAIGAIAGRVIGKNGTGAAVGAVAGGAAGAVYANRTKDHDIVLSPGSSIDVVLTSAFSRTVVAGR